MSIRLPDGTPLGDATREQLYNLSFELFAADPDNRWVSVVYICERLKRPTEYPSPVFDWRALLRAVDKVTDRALTRLYFARSHRGRVTKIIVEAIDVPVSPWGVKKPPYGDRIFRGEKGK